MTFLEKVNELIKQKGITKNKLLNDLKLGKNSFNNWQERGNIPKVDTLSKLAEYFCVPVDYLLDDEKSTPIEVHDEDDNIVVLDDETLKIIDTLRSRPEMKMLFSVTSKATPEDIIKAVRIIEALRDDSGHK